MLRMLSVLILSLICGLAWSQPSELRPVTHEDVWLMQRLGSPVLSPDGRQAVVSVTEPSYEDDGEVSDLWLITVDGSVPPRRLTHTPGGESGVDWRPDGGAIAFSAKRSTDEDAKAQIHVLPMNGPGEAIAITALSTGASSPLWSPDGSMIAFESRVWPDAADDAANAERAQAEEDAGVNVSRYEIFPIRDWDHWRDEKQTRLFVTAAEPGAEVRDLMFGSDLVSGPGYEGGLDAAWTPDGQALVVTATENLHEAAHAVVRQHLYRISLEGEVEAVTDSQDYSCTGAMFSPDGDYLYCAWEPINEYVYNHTEIARARWNGEGIDGELEVLTADFDRSVNGGDLSPDGQTFYFSAHDHGRTRLFAMPAAGGEVRVLDAESSGVYGSPVASDDALVAVWESSTTPAELVRVDPATGQHVALTSFNSERAAGLDRPAFREFWFTSSKGRRIHNWIALPPGFDENERYPLVLFIHGGPFSSSLDSDHVRWSPHLLASAGYVVLLTDYTGSVGYGAEFSRNIEGDPLKTPGEELIEAADAAIERFAFIDPERQAASGASYGGHLVNWLLATTDRFDALVGHAGLVDLEGQYSTSDGIYHRERMNGGPPWGDSPVWREQSPSTYAGQFSTPTMLTIGELDYRVPVNQTIAAWSYLQRMQVPSRLLVFHDANHWIMNGKEAKYFWDEVHAWLAEYLKD
ncbi:S9 family peptidase [Wenzhouxiangella marina]|uniref:Dipeptidyl aminopeptidase/acylaminoacyl peptidase n=1 Tax=Wenzhouxiangella marina TaxID=1579979 RepID=A0A0K0XZX8_9GAMM|nr:S9 family peptidase [Wenzhouxiangella marina]AKS43191.1 Dipeptidyl aminopeptidase/acylaminoacyl peptidase [Wenzhouxiangella marina]MBB6087123.1 dipeptidyl aminopeptidase/acylaminoacyl peptidase [Wenzhouxiangella marina]